MRRSSLIAVGGMFALIAAVVIAVMVRGRRRQEHNGAGDVSRQRQGGAVMNKHAVVNKHRAVTNKHKVVRRAATAAATVAAALLATTTAYGYWETTGTGTGTATTADVTIDALAVTTNEVPSSSLVPNGPAADALVKVSNPNTFSVTVWSVTATGAAVAANGCQPTGVTFTDASSLGIDVAAGATTLVTLPGAVAMEGTAASTCQGTTFSIPVTVTVRR